MERCGASLKCFNPISLRSLSALFALPRLPLVLSPFGLSRRPPLARVRIVPFAGASKRGRLSTTDRPGYLLSLAEQSMAKGSAHRRALLIRAPE